MIKALISWILLTTYNNNIANLIAEGIAAGKVNTIVVPMDFKGMVNITPK